MKKVTIITLFSIVGLGWGIFPSNDEAAPVTSEDHRICLDSCEMGPAPIQYPSIKVPKVEERTKRFKVKYGDSFHGILKALGIERDKLNKINSQLKKLINPKEFHVGTPYSICFREDGLKPFKLVYEADVLKPIEVDFQTATVHQIEKEVDVVLDTIYAAITSSLASSLIELEAPEDLADKVLSILAWKIDFDHLEKGDEYMVLYEKAYVDNQMIGSRNVMAVMFKHANELFQGYAFDTGNGIEYFDEKGLNLSHAPLQFDLITSLYNRRRFHPVRRTYRAHLGMDFEAKKGTPVEAALDGIIIDARYARGNGKFVKIKHTNELTTQYLHLSKIDSGISVGQKVLRGQKIGEVGSTGLSSGPHLCLRVWHNGKQKDPLSFDFPRRADISKDHLEEFLELVKTYRFLNSFQGHENFTAIAMSN